MRTVADKTNDLPEGLWDKSRVARHCGWKATRTVDNAMKKGLPFIKFGGKNVRFRKADVDAWIEGQRQVQRAA